MNNLKDIHNCIEFDTFEVKGCYIRISMNNLKDIHNLLSLHTFSSEVVILGFQ